MIPPDPRKVLIQFSRPIHFGEKLSDDFVTGTIPDAADFIPGDTIIITPRPKPIVTAVIVTKSIVTAPDSERTYRWRFL